MAADHPQVRQRIMIYALGGGLGHVTRAIAVARQLVRLIDSDCQVLTNSPFASAVQQEVAETTGLSLVTFSPQATADEVGSAVRTLVTQWQPTVLIVDTFPRGIGGELAALLPEWHAGKKVLLGRTLPADYVNCFRLREFVVQNFDLVIVPGEASPWDDLPRSQRVAPIVIGTAEEQLPPAQARQTLHLSPEEQCVLVVGSGTQQELQHWDDLVCQLAGDWPKDWPPLRWALPPGQNLGLFKGAQLYPEIIVQQFPVSRLFSAAAVLIGSAGYNLVHEAQQAGIALVAVARERQYDQQRQRLQNATCASEFSDVVELQEKLHQLLRSTPEFRLPEAMSNHGARAAADLIAALLSKTSAG